MIIDFHTHIFPEKMAARTIESLKAGIKRERQYDADSYADGTLEGLKESMKINGVDKSIVMPIATRPKHTETINDFAKKVTCENVISFASVHPQCEDMENLIKSLKAQGFRGIKLHPEFQDFYIDSRESVELFKIAEKYKMYITFHAGWDVGMPPPVHATVDGIAHLLEYVSGKYVIAAHMGGFEMWDEVEERLAGTQIYMDTAVVSTFIDKDQYRRIIKKHGADKILFGSDSPWESPSDTLKALTDLGLTQQELELITHLNAEKILNEKE